MIWNAELVLRQATNCEIWRILQIKCTDKFWDLLRLWDHLWKQMLNSLIPVSAFTSDIQGINIKLINENLGDKIMFFLMIPRFSHLTKNEQTLPWHALYTYVKYFNLRRKVLTPEILFSHQVSTDCVYKHVLNKTRSLLCVTSFNLRQAPWYRAPTETYNAQTHVIKFSTGCLYFAPPPPENFFFSPLSPSLSEAEFKTERVLWCKWNNIFKTRQNRLQV